MTTISVDGLTGKAQAVECTAQVLGDPKLFDPAVGEDVSVFQRLSAVSPCGTWMALRRKGCRSGAAVFTIARTQEGAEEITIPLSRDWKWPHICGIADDGTILFRAELNHFDNGYSRRPLLFKPGDQKSLILPPPYDKEAKWKGCLSGEEDIRPVSHTPHCYAPNGTVFGWTKGKYGDREEHRRYDTPHCVWEKQPSGKWTVECLPDSLNSQWLWPGYGGTFVWADRPKEDDTISFGLFDGTSTTTFDVTLKGTDPKTIGVAADGTFFGHYGVKDGRSGKDEKGEPMCSYYAYLVRPQSNAVRVFNDVEKDENNPQLEALSSNGQYVIGSHLGVGVCILQAHNGGYRYGVLKAPGWRIDGLTCVTDDGKVFATATCTERKHGCFRLKLPVLLTPQW